MQLPSWLHTSTFLRCPGFVRLRFPTKHPHSCVRALFLSYRIPDTTLI